MSVTMRILQRFDVRKTSEFLDLEKKFAALEKRRPDYPKARRMKPIAADEPINTLIWECEFKSLNDAKEALDFFAGDAEHDVLYPLQLPFFEQVKIGFYENLEY
jgi:hypothetical protein